MRKVLVLTCGIIISVMIYCIGLYNAEVERQETARMDICIRGGGKWITAWNWKTYCSP